MTIIMKITGKVTKVNIGSGCWGIVTSSGKEFRIVNMPQQLKEDGKKVTVRARRVDEMSIFQWGEAVKITTFET